jgi:SAM-dependent methyltransferase
VAKVPEFLRSAARSTLGAMPASVQERVRLARMPKAERDRIPPSSAPATDNLAYNEALWDWYAERWGDEGFRAEQLHHEGRTEAEARELVRLGEEWGRLDDAVQVIEEWILPHVTASSVVGEIGTGGGRVSVRVAPHAGEFHCFDVSRNMLRLVDKELRDLGVVPHLHHVPEPRLPDELAGALDVLYSFDVFVHLDLHVQWRYFQEMARVLRSGGTGIIHTSNLVSPGGWERFAAQGSYRVEGFYFMTPEAVRTLVDKAGLRLVRHQLGDEPGNFYYGRDQIVVVEKP